MARGHSPLLLGRQTAASAENLISRAAGMIVSRESGRQGRSSGRRRQQMANGRWRCRQGRSATSAGMIGDGREACRCSRVWIGEDVSAQTILREDIREEANNTDDIYRQGRCIGREDIRENIRQRKYSGKYIAEDWQQGDGTAMYRLQSKSAKIGEDREKNDTL